MLEHLVKQLLVAAWKTIVPAGDASQVKVEPSDRPEFGDFTTNLALVGASVAGTTPRKLADRVAAALPAETMTRVEVAGPGFINLFVRPRAVHEALRQILVAGDSFGALSDGGGKRLQVEFVSSNPTGPLTVGHGRQAVLGDVLASLYAAIGFTVEREYYFNDEGRQVDLLAESLWARYRQALGAEAEIPDGGYEGDYLVAIGAELAADWEDRYPRFDEAACAELRRIAVDRISVGIREDLAALGVSFDHWFSETTLHRTGQVRGTLARLTERGGTYAKEGATWLAAEAHGGDRDAVLVRSDGRPTYLLVDIAYHLNKSERGFERVINVQGADHHAEQRAMGAAMRILGLPDAFLDYAVHQLVSLKASGETTRMSTRSGRFVTLRSLVDELGSDVVRYFMVARKPTHHLEFDLDLARSESLDNPVTYIQYAHTRIASVLRKAGDVDAEVNAETLEPLQLPEELELIKLLDRLPSCLLEAGLSFSPHLVAEYALQLSRRFHAYYTDHRILGDDARLQASRLALVRGVKLVLGRCLRVLGMSAPEAM